MKTDVARINGSYCTYDYTIPLSKLRPVGMLHVWDLPCIPLPWHSHVLSAVAAGAAARIMKGLLV